MNARDCLILRAYLSRAMPDSPRYHPGRAERFMRSPRYRWRVLLAASEAKP